MAQKGKSHVEIATADGTLYVIPITPEIVRVIFVKGIGGSRTKPIGSKRPIQPSNGWQRNPNRLLKFKRRS